jgi:hypothetical protein
MENLYDFLFHYNSFTKQWNAIPREKISEYWNNRKTEGVLSSSSINTLMELITKGDEFIKSIE